jgi:hypothetical protein
VTSLSRASVAAASIIESFSSANCLTNLPGILKSPFTGKMAFSRFSAVSEFFALILDFEKRRFVLPL